jgi:hypothetical protein
MKFDLLSKLLVVSTTLFTASACSWSVVEPPQPSRFMSASSTEIGKSVAWCGGTFLDPKTGNMIHGRNQVTTFNPSSKTWTTFPNMTARSKPACSYYDGRLYVFAGVQERPNASHSIDPTIKLAVVESIAVNEEGTPTETSWTLEKDLPFGPRESPSSTSLPSGEGIIFAGGFNSWTTKDGVFHFEYFNTTYLFDGAKYNKLPDMPFKRSNFNLLSTKENIVYAFGGGEDEPSYSTCAYLDMNTYKGNPDNVKWVKCPAMINPRSWAAAGIVNSQIVLAGGMDGQFSPTSEVDVLNTKTLSNWTMTNCNLPIGAAFLSGSVTSNGEFLVYIGVGPSGNTYMYKP